MKQHEIRMKQYDFILMSLTIVIFLLLMALLSYFGISLHDEPFPFATALRFFQGQKPFVDDLSPYIPLAFLLMPLVKLSLILHHGKNELILFLRHLYLFFQIGLGIYTYVCVKKYLPTLAAFFIAIFIMAYHPFGINNFHYDTLGASFWAIILFQNYNFLFQKNNTWYSYLLFSIMNVLLCFAYPTFIFLLLPLFACSSFILSDAKRFWISHLFIGLIVLMNLYFIIKFYFQVDATQIWYTVSFIKKFFQFYAHQQSTFQKWMQVFKLILSEYGKYIISATLLVSMAALFRKRKYLTPILLCLSLLAPFTGLTGESIKYAETFYFLNCIGFSGAIIYLFFLRNHVLAKRLF